MIPTVFYGVVLGAVVGLIWTLALDIRFATGVVTSAVVGCLLALIAALFGKMARVGSNLEPGETYVVSNGIVTFLAMACGAVGLLVWLGRALFS
ncbi:MAG TPA: hypothetical protein VMO47_00535 [Rhodothermales bacterium]|nr:hypothetical protein [Rhodothermales bacterium]